VNECVANAVNTSAEILRCLLVTWLPIGWAEAGAGAVGGTWLDLLIAAAERQSVWTSLQRCWLWTMFSAHAAERWAVWFSRRRQRLWVLSAFLSIALCMWDVDILANFVGWMSRSQRGSSPVSVSSTYSSFSGNPNMLFSLLPCWHNRCAFLTWLEVTSDEAFTFWIDCGINCFSPELNVSLWVNDYCLGRFSDFMDHLLATGFVWWASGPHGLYVVWRAVRTHRKLVLS